MEGFDIFVDTERNRLYITLNGFFNDEKARQAAEAVEEKIAQMQPGFTIVNDIRGFKPTTPAGAASIQKAQQKAVEIGVRHVVRVVTQEQYNVAQMQFKRKGRTAGLISSEAVSVDEADKILDREEDTP